MTPVRWRRAAPADARALSYLGAATFLESFAFDHPGAALLDHLEKAHGQAYYEAAIGHSDAIVIIGETPLGAPVGYAVLTPPDLPIESESDDFELKRIYLLAGWQGGGHGDALMNEALTAARSRGAKRLLLAVYPQNEKARRFYARHGFEQIGTTTFMVGDVPFTDHIFAAPL